MLKKYEPLLTQIAVTLVLLSYLIRWAFYNHQSIEVDYQLTPYTQGANAAVFAAYSADGTIPDYVLDYLYKLKQIAPNIVYVTDNPIRRGEIKKLEPLVNHITAYRHGEYDWGSYKQGYNWLKRNGYLEKADELIFANDSTYAPLGGSFQPMFDEMSARPDIDFWGNTQNIRIFSHIQSYFMVFKKNVFTHPDFSAFINKVTTEEQKIDVVYKYEIPFTPYLENLGFKWQTYVPKTTPPPLSSKIEDTDPWIYPQTTVFTHHSPFLKRKRYYRDYAPPKEPYNEVLKYLKKNSPHIYQNIKE